MMEVASFFLSRCFDRSMASIGESGRFPMTSIGHLAICPLLLCLTTVTLGLRAIRKCDADERTTRQTKDRRGWVSSKHHTEPTADLEKDRDRENSEKKLRLSRQQAAERDLPAEEPPIMLVFWLVQHFHSNGSCYL